MRSMRALSTILILSLIGIGLIIGFFVTGNTGLLFAAIVLGVIDTIFICLSLDLILGVAKMIYKGLKTGEWY